MKPFIFRLDRVLNLRFRTERERARILQEAIRCQRDRRMEREEAEERLDRCGSQVAEAANAPTRAGTLHNLGLAVIAAADRLEAAEDSLRTAEETLQEEQERFTEARKDRRVIEKLRERRHEDWSVETSRFEQRTIDAIAQQRRAAGGER